MANRAVIVQLPADLAFLPLLRQGVVTLCEPVMREAEIYQLQLAVSELVTNIVLHSYDGIEDGVVWFEVKIENNRVVLDIYDTGAAFTPGEPRVPDADALLEGGYGLYLIQQSVDVMQSTREADGRNHWHLEKRLAVAAHEGGNASWT